MRAERESEARRLRGRLVDELVEEGLPLDAGWLAAFAAVPRHEFLPWLFEQRPDGAWSLLTSAEESWLRNVYRNRVAITQLDGDESLRAGGAGRTGARHADLLLQRALDHGDHVGRLGHSRRRHRAGDRGRHRLQRGAAVPPARPDRVTTVDVDPAIAARAAEHLAAVGFHPTCVATDGAEGYPANAPYDRVLGTCSVSTIPLAWLAQTAPGGHIVTTLNRQLGAGLVKLTPDGDGRATGRVLASDGRFMPLRAHRGPRVSELADKVRGSQGSARTTELTPKRLLRPADRFEFFAGLALPHVSAWSDTRSQTWLAHADGSWACYSRHSVSEGGPRRLWSIAEAAHEEWQALGQPPRERFGLTVTPGGQEFWLDSPDSPHRWPLD